MLQITFQSRVLFLGKMRVPGEVLPPEELAEALESERTSMTAVTAMKNRGLAILQESGGGNDTADTGRIERIERNIALIGKALGIDLETAAPPAAKPRSRKTA